MQLHTLTFAALGPFPGEHTVDFAALGSSGLFLLEGPTGSGKSTLIDAIVFALYGKVASKDASEERLRSGHAAPDAETFVDLVFESGPGVYRVRRTPAYARPKRHGRGTTVQPATAKLWRLTSPDAPEGDPISTRVDEVGAELQRAIGLDRAQFVQTVVLPQGEFASFLRANPEDRRGLLQKVFGTDVYDRVEQRLAAMRVEANRTLQGARDAVGRAAEHFLGASGLPDAAAEAVRAAAGETAPDGALAALVTEAADGARRDATTAGQVAEQARAARAATQRAFEEARAGLDLVRRRDGLRAERAVLEAGAAAHADDVARLARARRAERVWPSLLGAGQAVEAVLVAEAAVRAARNAAGAHTGLADLVDESADPVVRVKVLADERDGCAATRAGLRRPLGLEQGLAARRTRLAADEAAVAQRLAEREALVAELAGRPALRAELVARRDAAASAADGLGAADAAVAAARGVHAAAEQARTLAGEEAAAIRSLEDAAATAAARTSGVHELQQRRIAGIAGELAADLAPGRPCPVCGATEHPHPAEAGPEPVTAELIAAAEAQRVEADGVLTEAKAALVEVRTRRESAEAGAGGLDPAESRVRLEAAVAVVEAARTALAERERLAGELTEFDAGTQRSAEARAALDQDVAVAQTQLDLARTALAADEAEVAGARGDASSVAGRAAALDARLGAVVAWLDALEGLVRAKARHTERAAELDAAVAAQGFAEVVEVRDAVLPADALAALEARIAEHEQVRALVDAGLAEPEVAGLAPDLTSEVAADRVSDAEAAHATANAEASRADGEAARLAGLAASAMAAATEVERAVSRLAHAYQVAVPVIRMANLVAAIGGDNAQQLTLGTYVLVRRFEDVVAAANSRLLAMSGGRYELARSEEREAVRALRRGLAMKVLDHEIEAERDPRTLSGGETFYVSLCLALGLADVVTAEAGGIDLGTLFVDEGFGALDAETLDTVLAELGRLRAGGRVVGVVSHVEALKQTIAERVEVRRGTDGASTLTVRA